MNATLMLLLLALLLAAAGAYALWLFFKSPAQRSPEEKFVRASCPVLLTLLAVLWLGTIASTPSRDWNACRVAPSVALTHGYTLYYPADRGPILNTLYAPLTAVFFLPAALGKDPTGAILIAATINLLSMTLPLLLLLLLAPAKYQGRFGLSLRIVAFVFGAACLYHFDGTAYMQRSIHADAPAVGLTLIACTILVSCANTPSVPRLIWASLFAAMAVWTKQIEVFALPGLFLFIGFAWSWRLAFGFAALVAAWGAALLVAFSAWFGFREMMFNIVTVPGAHDWKGARIPALLRSFIKLGFSAMFLLLLAAPFSLKLLQPSRGSMGDLKSVLNRHRWLLLAVVALTMIPGSLLGEVKIGGRENSYHSVYFLLAGVTMALWQWARRASETNGQVALPALYLLAAVVLGLKTPSLTEVLRLRHIRDNPQQQAYELALRRPGEVFFPWNTLSTLYAEHQVHHFEYGVYDRVLAKHPPTDEHIRAHLPARMKYLIYRADREVYQLRQRLPEFSQVNHVRHLTHSLEAAEVPGTHDPMEPPEVHEHDTGGWLVYRRRE